MRRTQPTVSRQVLSLLQTQLLEKLEPEGGGGFRFVDVLSLEPSELILLCERLGSRVLSTALATLTKPELATLTKPLTPDQNTLVARAIDAAGKTRSAEATELLELHGVSVNLSDGLRSAGAFWLVRAARAHSQSAAARLIELSPRRI